MSDVPDGPGSWQASDGKWYPAELHPGAQPNLPPPVAPNPTSVSAPPPAGAIVPRKKPWWRRWWAIALGVLVLIVGIAAVASPDDDEADLDDAGQPAANVVDETDEDAASAEPDESDESDSADSEDSAADEDPEEEAPDEDTDAEAEPEPEQPKIGTREQPFAIGAPVLFTVDSFGDADRSQWTLTVDGPGADITRAVLDENPFNEPPDEGMLFYGVPVTLTLESAEKEPLSPWLNISLEYFGPSTLEIISAGFSEGCGVVPGGLDSLKEVFAGGSISGMVCYAVTAADADAGILLTLDEIEGDRIFIATVPGVGTAPAGEPIPTLPPITTTPPGGGEAGSRSAPHPVGAPVLFTVDSFGDADRSQWTLTVDGPGADITRAVLDENPFNEPPDEGMLFYGVPVTLTLESAEKEPLSPWLNISLEYFGPSTLEIISAGFSEGCGVVPGGLDSLKEVFAGGSISGMVCYAVTAADADAGILLTLDEIEGDRIFIATR